jgi:Multiubiquitin
MAQTMKPEDETTHVVTITVNNNPVEVEGPRLSGLAIKEAAIAQGVAIELDFQLAEIKNKKRVIIGNDEIVTVNKDSTFGATATDDNS